MADPRLQWRQLNQAQPNVAPLLGQASRSMNDAFEAANGILEKYQTGLESKGDAEAAHRLAGINDEAELDAFLANGGLSDLNISESMRNNLMNARGAALGFENSRSITSDRDQRLTIHGRNIDSQIATRAGQLDIARGNLAISQAAEGRRAATYADEVASRDALRAASGDIQAAQAFEREYGQTVGPIRQTGGVLQQAYEGLIARGMAPHIAEGFIMNFEDESGGRLDAIEAVPNVHGTRGRGLYQLTGDRRTAFEQRYGTGSGAYSLDNQLDWLMHELGGSESRAWQRIQQAGTAGEAGAAIVTNFLRPAEEHRARRSRRYLDGATGQIVTEIDTPIMTARQRLIDSGQFTSDQIDRALSGATEAGEIRSSELAREDEETIRELTAQANQSLLDNPEINTIADLREATLSDDRFTASENEARLGQLMQMIQADPGRLRPSVPDDPALDASIAGSLEAADRAIEATPQYSLFADAERLAPTDTATVGDQVARRLGLGSDGENPGGILGFFGAESGFDVRRLDTMIGDAARRNNVRPEVAAAAMVKAFERDPFGRNTLSNRFDADRVDEIISGISQTDERDFREAQRSVGVMREQMNQVRSQISLIRAQMSQLPEGSPQYQALAAQLQALNGQLATIERSRSFAPQG